MHGMVFFVVMALASGYLLYETRLWRRRFRASPGYNLYFSVLVIGLGWTFLSEWIYWLVTGLPKFPFLADKSELHQPLAGLIAAFAVNRFGHYLLAFWFWLCDQLESQRALQGEFDALLKAQNFFEAHVFEVGMAGGTLMATMENRRVYVGFPGTIKLESGAKWLTLTPVASGYRDVNAADVQFNVYYPENKEKKGQNIERYQVTLPIDKIMSIQNFNMKLYHECFVADDANRTSTSFSTSASGGEKTPSTESQKSSVQISCSVDIKQGDKPAP